MTTAPPQQPLESAVPAHGGSLVPLPFYGQCTVWSGAIGCQLAFAVVRDRSKAARQMVVALVSKMPRHKTQGPSSTRWLLHLYPCLPEASASLLHSAAV